MGDEVSAKVSDHYAPPGLKEAIASAVESAGRNPSTLTSEDFVLIDQFHVLGSAATTRLAERADAGSSSRVLDVGSGLGGVARHLASTYGCDVTGIDIADEYIECARFLTKLLRLEGSVRFEKGYATDLRYDDASFDLVWTQHAQQNIDGKERFFSELHRVLTAGGRCVMHDLFRGHGPEPTFPAYWGRDPSVSFLIPEVETKELLEQVGFTILDWQDTTRETLEWHLAISDTGQRPLTTCKASAASTSTCSSVPTPASCTRMRSPISRTTRSGPSRLCSRGDRAAPAMDEVEP